MTVCQHVQHDLCAQLKSHTKSLAIGQHINLPLGGHVILEQLLLIFREAIAGGIAEAFFGVPDEYRVMARSYLDERLLRICDDFYRWICTTPSRKCTTVF